MPDPLGIVRALETLPARDIAVLADLSGVSPARIRDAYDLADALEKPDAVQRRLQRTNRRAVEALRGLYGTAVRSAVTTVTADMMAELHRLLLVDADGNPLDAVRALLEHPLPPMPSGGSVSPSATFDDAATIAYRTERGLAGLLYAIREEPVHALAKGGISSGDASRLREECSVDDPGSLLECADAAGLLALLPHRRVTAGGRAADWLALRPWDRWRALADDWIDGLPPLIREALLAAFDQDGAAWREGTCARIPFESSWRETWIAVAGRSAQMLGLVEDRGSTELYAYWRAGDDSLEARLREACYPMIDYVYPQADLSVIAPGILDGGIEQDLRRVADCERCGDASVYRLSPSSLSRALRSGSSVGEILGFLRRVAKGGLPQPIEYLVEETGRRFGEIRLSRAGSGSRLDVADATLASTLLHDRDLVSLRLVERGDRVLESPLSPETVAETLSGARYAAEVRADVRTTHSSRQEQEGAVGLWPRERMPSARLMEMAVAVQQRLAKTDDQTLEIDQLGRVLELAARQRTPLDIVVTMPSGEEAHFGLVPSGISGGRVRGRDVGGDMERTLPLSRIVSVQVIR